MSRVVVNVSTGRYVCGQARLRAVVNADGYPLVSWSDVMPPGSPSHLDVPYAFKGFAMQAAIEGGYTTLLWADASILPIRSLGPLFDRIERDGYWISRNGYRNSEWTNLAALTDLFPDMSLDMAVAVNYEIEHVVATSFGINILHPTGKAIFDEYYRLAQTRAFCGPWKGGIGVQHRHDQVGLSTAAWRAGAVLTSPPEVFAYAGGEVESTILTADARY